MIVQCFKLQRLGPCLPIDSRKAPTGGLDLYMETLKSENRLAVGFYMVTRSSVAAGSTVSVPGIPSSTPAMPYTDTIKLYQVKSKRGKLDVRMFFPSAMDIPSVVSWPPK